MKHSVDTKGNEFRYIGLQVPATAAKYFTVLTYLALQKFYFVNKVGKKIPMRLYAGMMSLTL